MNYQRCSNNRCRRTHSSSRKESYFGIFSVALFILFTPASAFLGFPVGISKDCPLNAHGYHSIRSRMALKVVSEKRDPEWNKLRTDNRTSLRFLNNSTLLPVLLLLLQSTLAALVLIGWEDITCTNTLPSRHRTTLYLATDHSWGTSTIHGLAFGQTQRQYLLPDGDLSHIPSYNEVGLRHRQEQVPRWKRQQQQSGRIDSSANPSSSVAASSSSSSMTVPTATHVLLSCLQTVHALQKSAANYQWDTIQTSLRQEPLASLEMAASTLRPVVDNGATTTTNADTNVVGFDWGSCAWRHCGALADAQEALDELEHLVGVLEPFEAIFCLDIVERSLRDILAVVPWENMNVEDQNVWRRLPPYESKVSAASPEADGDSGEENASRLDEAYFQALQEFRVD